MQFSAENIGNQFKFINGKTKTSDVRTLYGYDRSKPHVLLDRKG